ncbi:MAG: ferritin [Ignavibacteriales bacterium]
MASEKMLKELNEHLNREFFSSYLYLSMSSFLNKLNYDGMAAWMKMQSGEEYGHAMKFFDYVNKIGGSVVLQKIDKPENVWDSPLTVFEETLKHEKFITKSINELANLATEERDHATMSFLGYFINEQVEEEDTAAKIVDKFKLVGDNKGGLYMLDRELGARRG